MPKENLFTSLLTQFVFRAEVTIWYSMVSDLWKGRGEGATTGGYHRE